MLVQQMLRQLTARLGLYQVLGNSCLELPVVVGDVISVVAAIARDVSGIEFAAAPIIGFDLVPFR